MHRDKIEKDFKDKGDEVLENEMLEQERSRYLPDRTKPARASGNVRQCGHHHEHSRVVMIFLISGRKSVLGSLMLLSRVLKSL